MGALASSSNRIMKLYDNIPDLPPPVVGVVMAIVIAVIRVIYDREETSVVRIGLESLLCGSLALTAGTAIQALGYDQNWTLFAGGAIGFMGSQTIRAYALLLCNRRF